MYNDEDFYREDTLSVGKGIVYGILFGILLWAAIIGVVLLIVKLA